MCVAQGAAIQAAFKSLNPAHRVGLGDYLISDATPLSLGVYSGSDKLSVLIPKNTLIPYDMTKTYHNDSSNVDEIEILVYQGDNPDGSEGSIKISDCVKVSEVILSGFQDRKAGDSKIDVKFDVDSNGLLKVTATDVRSGRSTEL